MSYSLKENFMLIWVSGREVVMLASKHSRQFQTGEYLFSSLFPGEAFCWGDGDINSREPVLSMNAAYLRLVPGGVFWSCEAENFFFGSPALGEKN